MTKSKSGSAARKQRRANGAAEKVGVKQRPGGALLQQYENAIKDLQAQVRVLQQNFEKLVSVHQENHQHLLTAFHMTDAHIWVLKNVQRDHVMATLKLTGIGEIDYTKYYEEFHTQHVAQLEAAAAQAKAEEEKAPEGGPVEFGGNYVQDEDDSDGSASTEGEGGGEDDGDEPAEDPVPPVQHADSPVAEQ